MDTTPLGPTVPPPDEVRWRAEHLALAGELDTAIELLVRLIAQRLGDLTKQQLSEVQYDLGVLRAVTGSLVPAQVAFRNALRSGDCPKPMRIVLGHELELVKAVHDERGRQARVRQMAIQLEKAHNLQSSSGHTVIAGAIAGVIGQAYAYVYDLDEAGRWFAQSLRELRKQPSLPYYFATDLRWRAMAKTRAG